MLPYSFSKIVKMIIVVVEGTIDFFKLTFFSLQFCVQIYKYMQEMFRINDVHTHGNKHV